MLTLVHCVTAESVSHPPSCILSTILFSNNDRTVGGWDMWNVLSTFISSTVTVIRVRNFGWQDITRIIRSHRSPHFHRIGIRKAICMCLVSWLWLIPAGPCSFVPRYPHRSVMMELTNNFSSVLNSVDKKNSSSVKILTFIAPVHNRGCPMSVNI